MTGPTTVLEMAEAVAARARSDKASSSDRDVLTRVATSVDELETAVAALETASSTFEDARADVPGISFVAPSSVDGPSAFRTRIDPGLPTHQYVRAARDRVLAAAAAVRTTVDAGWLPWATERLEQAATGRVSLLGPAQRPVAAAKVRSLGAAVAGKQVDATLMARFHHDLDDLLRMLGAVREDDPVVGLLERVRVGTLTLQDLTDAELALLRVNDDVARQVLLRL